MTEFQAQGLELDAVLFAWDTDLRVVDGAWSNQLAKGYQQKGSVKDPMRLRKNAYRVLLTRGRDATVIYVPPLPELDETFAYLTDAGVVELREWQAGGFDSGRLGAVKDKGV